MKQNINELEIRIEYLNDRLYSKGISSNNKPILMDYVPPLGDNLGYTSLELLLLSLSSCITNTMIIFLRKMRKDINVVSVIAKGVRKSEHPTGFKAIQIELIIKSGDLTNDIVDNVIKQSENQYCPVWSMLKGNVDVQVIYKIIKTSKNGD